MLPLFIRLLKDESGATAIEYAIIAALLSVSGIAAFQALGETLNSIFATVAANVDAADTNFGADSSSLGEGDVGATGAQAND
ncbi:MAG: Flp family type IVb pilin [Alphaproteobacteria bacterium]|nr:Flp family type IVb pilin [Alphaproteobacteria bacterium]